jgi:hypothetical protein
MEKIIKKLKSKYYKDYKRMSLNNKAKIRETKTLLAYANIRVFKFT